MPILLPRLPRLTAQAASPLLFRRLEQCLGHFDSPQALINLQNPTSPAYRDYFQAMAYHRLGHKQEARKYLQWATVQTDKEIRDDAQTPDLNNWVRKATLQLLRAEAEAVLRGSTTTGANRVTSEVFSAQYGFAMFVATWRVLA